MPAPSLSADRRVVLIGDVQAQICWACIGSTHCTAEWKPIQHTQRSETKTWTMWQAICNNSVSLASTTATPEATDNHSASKNCFLLLTMLLFYGERGVLKQAMCLAPPKKHVQGWCRRSILNSLLLEENICRTPNWELWPKAFGEVWRNFKCYEPRAPWACPPPRRAHRWCGGTRPRRTPFPAHKNLSASSSK